MGNVASINQTGTGIRLPNFCNLGVMLRSLVVVNLLLAAGAVLRVADLRGAPKEFMDMATFVEPILIVSLYALCGARRWLYAIGYARSIAVLFAFELLLAWGMARTVGDLFADHNMAFGRLAVLVVVVTGITLVYFDLRSRALADHDPRGVVAAKGLLGGLASAAVALAFGEVAPRPAAAAALLGLGAIGFGVSLQLYLGAQRLVGAARTASVFAAAPLAGVAAAFALGAPWPGPALPVAVALVGAGLWLHASERHRHRHHHAALEHEHMHRHDDGHHTHRHDPMPSGPHSHPHRHEETTHEHEHGEDLHHRHAHPHAEEDPR